MSFLGDFRKSKKNNSGREFGMPPNDQMYLKKLQKETKVMSSKYAGRMLWKDIRMHLSGKRNMVLQRYNLLLRQFEIDHTSELRWKMVTTKMNNNKILFNSKNLLPPSLSSPQRQETKLAGSITWCCFKNWLK